MRTAALSIASAALLAACATAPVDPGMVEMVDWRATSVNGLRPVPGHEIRLTMASGAIKGTTGCNGFGGDGRVVGGLLILDEVAMTAAACVDPQPALLEQAFVAVLTSRPAVSVAEGQLVLRSAAGEVVLERWAPSQASPNAP